MEDKMEVYVIGMEDEYGDFISFSSPEEDMTVLYIGMPREKVEEYLNKFKRSVPEAKLYRLVEVDAKLCKCP